MTDLTSCWVTDDPERVKTQVKIFSSPYEAAAGAHAVVICTEWDEFIVSVFLFMVYIMLVLDNNK